MRQITRFKPFFITLALVASSSIFSILCTNTTSASDVGYWSGRNNAERASWANGDPCGSIQGAACATWWLSYVGADYFSEIGTSPSNPLWVDWNATTAEASVRGSWNTQRSNDTHIYSLFTYRGGGRSVWVTNRQGHVDAAGNTYFDRGTRPDWTLWRWVNSWDYLNLAFDINGVGAPGGGAEKITLNGTSCLAVMRNGVVRTYSGNSINCGTENMELWIQRRPQPKGWAINSQSYVYSGGAYYKNYNNSQPDRYGAYNHAKDAPTISSGEMARFWTDLRNIELPGYGHSDADVQLRVENSYFQNYEKIANCERLNWDSCGSGTQAVVARGDYAGAGRLITKCQGTKYNNVAHIKLGYDELLKYDPSDDCTGAQVPADGSRIGWYICQKVSWVKKNSVAPHGTWDSSVPACYMIKSTFNLIPKIGDGSSSIGTVAQGGEVDAASIIENRGGILRNFPVDWATYDFKVPKAVLQAAGGEDAVVSLVNTVFNKSDGGLRYAEIDYSTTVRTVCEWVARNPQLAGRFSDCVGLANSIMSSVNAGSNQVNDSKLSAANAEVGDLVCRTVSIRHYNWDTRNSDNTMHRIAYPRCYRVAKKPSLQVWGNDVRVGSNSGVVTGLPATQYTNSSIVTAANALTSNNLDLSYGSWGEYGMTTPLLGTIKSANAGSLSGYGTGHAAPASQSVASRNKLSFANVGNGLGGDTFGKWGEISAQANVRGQFSRALPIGNSISLGGVASGTYNNTSGNVKISGEVGAGRSVIIVSNGTVIIDNNITYASSTYTKPSDITQLVIVARNIIIKDNVTRVDAWLVATPNTNNTSGGVISTCETSDNPAVLSRNQYSDGLSAANCNRELRVNGPVLARELQLRRTFGSEPTPGDNSGAGYSRSAETINMRADAYIWAANYISSRTGNIATDYTVELPPRY